MKAMHAHDVSEIVATSAFVEWFRRYRQVREQLETARQRQRQLSVDLTVAGHQADAAQQTGDELVFRAGECDDLSARAAAEYSDIENSSFELLSAFEHQRGVTTDAWDALGRTEKLVEDQRQLANEVRTRLEAVKKGAAAGAADEANRLQAELTDLEARIVEYGREAETYKQHFERELGRREALWREVESTWSTAFRANMARSEYAFQARRVRGQIAREAERRLAFRDRIEALTDESKRVAAAIAESEGQLAAHLQDGRNQFHCTLIEEFMYWPSETDPQAAFAVPLVDEGEHLNLQVTALQVYQIDRARGLDFLEPVVEKSDAGEDPRLGQFFARSGTAGA